MMSALHTFFTLTLLPSLLQPYCYSHSQARPLTRKKVRRKIPCEFPECPLLYRSKRITASLFRKRKSRRYNNLQPFLFDMPFYNYYIRTCSMSVHVLTQCLSMYLRNVCACTCTMSVHVLAQCLCMYLRNVCACTCIMIVYVLA